MVYNRLGNVSNVIYSFTRIFFENVKQIAFFFGAVFK